MSDITISKIAGAVVTGSSVTLVYILAGHAHDTVTTIPRDDFRYDLLKNVVVKDMGVRVGGRTMDVAHGVAEIQRILNLATPLAALADTPVVDRAVEAAAAGQDTEPLRRFHERLSMNPSASARASLYKHVRESRITVDADGCLVLYKRVGLSAGGRLASHHDSGFTYEVGKERTVPRERCGDTPDTTCGFGIHVCPWEHLHIWGQFGTVILELLCPPEDFTSVPIHEHKLRTCRVHVRRIVPEGEVPSAAVVEAARPAERRARKPRSTVVKLPGAPVIPQALCQEAGWQAGTRLRAVVPDPRSRAAYVTSLDDGALQKAGVLAPSREVPYLGVQVAVSRSRFTVSVPMSLLASASIAYARDAAGYVVRRLAEGLVEIRRAR